MSNLIELDNSSKSYSSYNNAVKTVNKQLPNLEKTNLKYFIYVIPGNSRFIPVFIGNEAISAGIHHKFSVVC